MTKDNKNDNQGNLGINVASFQQQFSTLDRDLKIMITLSALNGTTAALISSYVTASTIAAIRELDLITDPLVKSSQEAIILTTLAISKPKFTKPS